MLLTQSTTIIIIIRILEYVCVWTLHDIQFGSIHGAGHEAWDDKCR